MRIKLEANFDIDGIFSTGEVEIPASEVSLRMLLEELSNKCRGKIKFIVPENGQIDPDIYQVLVNGQPWESLPDRLEVHLSEGDRVLITKWPEMLGGG